VERAAFLRCSSFLAGLGIGPVWPQPGKYCPIASRKGPQSANGGDWQ
jgi:hypothetical protein